MALVQRNKACEEYARLYSQLTDTRKDTFSRLCNKLLNDNFIYASKQEDYNDYYLILPMRELFESFFSMIDYDLVHVDTYKIFYIQTNADRNRLKLKKIDTVILLVLRLIYYKQANNVISNSSSDIPTTLGNLISEINNTTVFKNPISNTDYKSSLALLKRYKIITYSFSDIKEDNVIVIYPTILYVAKIEGIDMLRQKINTYISMKEEDDNEIDED